MGLSLNSLQILASLGLSTEQMAGVVQVLTVELAPLEERRAKDRTRKILGRRSADNLRNVCGSSADEASRVDNLPSLSEDIETVRKEELSLSLSKPLNSRAHGTNPRALGTNPRALAAEPQGFAVFWSTYPKRAGDRDRKAAVKAFAAAAKRTPPETIIEGAARYAAHCDEAGKTGTEFVRQARTWLNANGWEEPYEISRSMTNGSSIRDSWTIASAVLAEQDRREGIRREGGEDDLRALPEPEGRA